MRALLDSRILVWTLLALPGAWLLLGYRGERLFYGEVVHLSGDIAIWFMMLAMSATPLLLMFPGRRVPRWVMRHRRAFGVASFAYALSHTLVYLDRAGALADVLDDAVDPAYGSGWVALLIFAALAATSNDASVRRLKRSWRRLHKLVYAAAVLGFAHWVLTAFDPATAWVHAGVLVSLEAVRLWLRRRTGRVSPRTP
jgi:sulfoxide reductase heme-binding subunit YedZ